ncbi:MAG: phosphatase PAP2 family protein [Clostridia bacterium]|nr:phosphatase PAP2 family protein [Clostridia bacterium]
MKKETQRNLFFAICLLTAFLLWTLAVRFVDVQAIGPMGSTVGFATINRFIHNLTGVNLHLYNITDWLGLLPLLFVAVFGFIGLIQWIKRKHLLKVDYSILVLGGFYIVVMAMYLLFEKVVINYRPVLINGLMEASYPSSTTMLVMCVIPTAIMQLNTRIKNNLIRRIVVVELSVFIMFMVLGRFVSGVHWFTDIIGGALLSMGLVLLYRAVVNLKVR